MRPRIIFKDEPAYAFDGYGTRLKRMNKVAFSWSGDIRIGVIDSIHPVGFGKNKFGNEIVARFELTVIEKNTEREVTVKDSRSVVKI